ncbi:Crp/Fnr family transcriptional regulator [Kutzneria albida]|nr:Crp/Fnr family transcriptional regulator [Kutzneria albida]
MAQHRGFRAMVTVQDWDRLLAAGQVRRFGQGEELLRQGAVGDHVLVLTVGRVKVLRAHENGSQLLVALRAAGDLVGEMASRGRGVRSATVVALEPCTAHVVPAAEFTPLLTRHNLYSPFTDYLTSKLYESVPYGVHLVHFRPAQQLARLLSEVVALAGNEVADPLRIPFSQEALASALGMARSTVSEAIAALRRDGVLTPGPALSVADPDRLAEHTSHTM